MLLKKKPRRFIIMRMEETVIQDMADMLIEFENIVWNGKECVGKKLK